VKNLTTTQYTTIEAVATEIIATQEYLQRLEKLHKEIMVAEKVRTLTSANLEKLFALLNTKPGPQ
jgi:hypothetical protein